MDKKRKRGRPIGGKGRTMKTFSVNMHPEQIKKLDRISDNRSSWLRDRVDDAKDKSNKKKP